MKLLLTKDFENWKFGEAKDADLALTNENTTYCLGRYVYVKDSKKEEKREDEDIYELGCTVCGNM